MTIFILKMLSFSKFIILWLILRCNYGARLPVSPCPNVFAYEGEPEEDRWYGVITFSSNIELVGMNYKVQLDRPSHLLVSWDGEVRSDDNVNYSVFDPFHTQRAGEIVKVRIMVKYNPDNIAPGISKIIINGNTLCSVNDISSGFGIGLGANGGSPSTSRPDPTFSEEDNSPDYQSNRGGSKNNYNAGSSNNNVNINRPNPSNYGNEFGSNNAPAPSYESNIPSYSQNTGYSNQNVPTYSNPNHVNNGGTFGSTANTNLNHPNTGSISPNYGSSGNGNPNYSGSSDNVEYLNQGTGTNSVIGESPSQWPETQHIGPNNIRNGSGSYVAQNAYVNPQKNLLDSNTMSDPIVTTLALQNGNSNKSSIDQILLNIKNQLDQSQVNSNKTFIVAVLYPTNNLAYSSTTESRHITESSTINRPTVTTPFASTIKIRSTPISTKQNNQRTKD